MIKRIFFNFNFIIFLYFFGTGLFGIENFVKAEPAQIYKQASKKYHLLYEVGEFRKYEHNWKNTIIQFQQIYKKYPKTIYAPKSLYNIGTLYTSLYRWNKKAENLDHSTRFWGVFLSNFENKFLPFGDYFEKIVFSYPKNSIIYQIIFRVLFYDSCLLGIILKAR